MNSRFGAEREARPLGGDVIGGDVREVFRGGTHPGGTLLDVTTAAHERLLTITETAQRLRVSEVTVRRLIRRGELPALQLGGPGTSVRVDELELAHWLYDNEGDAA